MEVRLTVFILALIGPAISQKLFFKSLKEDLQKNKEMVNLKESVVPCPGGKSACADGNTCCMLITRAFGCCALPNATCCLDGKHCCPKGLKCDLGRRACISVSEDIIIPWTETQSKQEVDQEVVKAVQCDNFHECPTGNTCCKLPTGQWGCCPKPNAVCCSDHTHCCPHDTTCDVSTGKCNQGNLQIDWFVKQPALRVGKVSCDKHHECEDGQTCCKLASGQWGCCPIPKAVCCSDHTHCCPHDTTCDVSTGKCNQGNLQIDWFVKQPALRVGKVSCDKHHECEDGQTCCKLASGQWGCCPIPKAVCCSDHTHCCPHDTTCDVSTGKCNQGNLQIDWFVKQPALRVGKVSCDKHHECEDGQTCCKLASGQWGCCPIPKAVCCSDKIHCCPENTKCDVSTGKCEHGNLQIDWYEKIESLSVGKVQCDELSYCEDGNTCCKTASGQWGCCPLPNAVCCKDHVHCCPEGTTCDVAEEKCDRGNLKIDWFTKHKSQTVSSVKVVADWIEKLPSMNVGNVKCDETHYCKDGYTCCLLASSQWGCCPLPNAVCCSDHVHCCPSGHTCDVTSGKCNQQTVNMEPISWVEKEPALKKDVMCDSTHYCQDGKTCCKLSSGQWGCCPLPNAVCCSDHVHCCPSGHTCDVTSGKCNQQTVNMEPISWVEKEPALKKDVMCDSTHYCQDGKTCCKLSSGQWGCCPLPNAVCCSDHVHCCPSGHTCDVTSGKCNQQTVNMEPISWVEKEPALKKDVMCDSTHYCQDGKTCCKLSSGQWGCCPLPNAVCCSDHVHCCPSGHTCDVTSGKCNQQTVNMEPISWVEKEPALKKDVMCDSTHYCQDGKTCCKLSSGQWGCCPLPNAVCCSDHVHCCPSGHTCDVTSGKCNQQTVNMEPISWVEKEPALKKDVMCDSTHYCQDGKTCCKLSSGQWGCCPLPNAVCCSDHVHCCPSGHTCDVTSGKCNQQTVNMEPISWVEKEPALKKDVMCDSTHYCQDGKTCCKLSSGQWGCCPLPNAVCCSDHVHCCPSGHTCDVTSGKCNQQTVNMEPISWVEKEPALKKDVMCDSTHYCPDGKTCCKLSSGQWGCCPLPNAVCCSDGEHCCPHGYTCDPSAGTCSKGNMKVEWYSKQAVTSPISKPNAVICPDGSECQDRQTCCPMYEETYGCCPMPNAVCCSDGEHCCPQGYECDVSHGTCISDMHSIDWSNTTSNKQPTLQEDKTSNDETVNAHEVPTRKVIHVDRVGKGHIVGMKKVGDGEVNDGVVPCEGTSQGCPDLFTCCQNNKAEFLCCPFHNGTCCPDREHCCPHGYICDEEQAICRILETKPGYKLLNKIYAKKGSPSL